MVDSLDLKSNFFIFVVKIFVQTNTPFNSINGELALLDLVHENHEFV